MWAWNYTDLSMDEDQHCSIKKASVNIAVHLEKQLILDSNRELEIFSHQNYDAHSVRVILLFSLYKKSASVKLF